MQLKRGGAVGVLQSLHVATVVLMSLQGEGWISRQASGLCFDFAPDDPSTYVTGTEEGSLHRCSVSYSEQYLDTYDPHSGPVYRLRFSPWWGDVFLSCSADWTMSLYHMRSTWPLLTFHSSGEDFSVNDIAWCPGNSTVSEYAYYISFVCLIGCVFVSGICRGNCRCETADLGYIRV